MPMQDWPVLRSLPSSAWVSATSMSASSVTMNAASPPSSIIGRTILAAAWPRIWEPTPVDPVKEIPRTAEWSAQAWVMTLAEPWTTFSTPSGRPASCSVDSQRFTASGAFSETRATTVFPAARAGATFRAWIETGKFHGVRVATTPSGRCMLSWRRAGSSEV